MRRELGADQSGWRGGDRHPVGPAPRAPEIELFGRVWPGMPRRVVNTHEDGDHVWGNQLFEGAEIIAHRTMPGRMKEAADPRAFQKLLDDVDRQPY